MTDKGKTGFKQAMDKMRESKEQAAEEEQKEKQAIIRQMSVKSIEQNSELAQMYKDNARVGAENLTGDLPLLKVHQTGKSTTNFLTNGEKPNDGWFFYRPTQEQFKTVDCHILTISRGFRAEGMDSRSKQDIFHQLMAGVITNDNSLKPFIFFFTGKKLKNLWEFGTQAQRYTRLKPIPIPLFALYVRLSTYEEENAYGMSWLVNFEILKGENEMPLVVSDPGEFQYLRDHVEIVKDTIESLISTKSTEDSDNLADEAQKIFAANEPPHPAEQDNVPY